MAGLSASLMLAACAGSLGVEGGGSQAVCEFGDTFFSGTVQYEDRPYNRNGFLDSTFRPVRLARVELYRAVRSGSEWVTDGGARAIGYTSQNGTFCLGVSGDIGTAIVRVKAFANTPGGTVQVHDGSTTYFMDSRLISSRQGEENAVGTMTVRRDSVWAPGAGQLGGAFNLLDAGVAGYEFLKREWDLDLAPLKIKWHARSGDGTYYDPAKNEIHMKGLVSGDSDEYDDDTLLHEMGHAVMHHLGVHASPGGTHYINGHTQDTRLAWSEGWASFFSAMVRDIRPSAWSNRETGKSWLIDAFGGTEGGQGALRFAYELATPTAAVPDRSKADQEPIEVNELVFRDLVKQSTSEVSVAAAMWDLYKGGNGFSGLGSGGMSDMLVRMADRWPQDLPEAAQVNIAHFWEVYEAANPARAEAARAFLVNDRLMTWVDDLYGADDTVAELAGLSSGEQNYHTFNVLPGSSNFELREGAMLYPEGDVDLYRFNAAGDGAYRIETTGLRDGADTLIELLDAEGNTVIAGNDNHIPYVLFFADDGQGTVDYYDIIAYNGQCGRVTLWSWVLNNNVSVNTCPPNSTNPTVHSLFAIEEYLSSAIEVELTAGTYLVRVSRSPDAPPSAGRYGGYDLLIQGM